MHKQFGKMQLKWACGHIESESAGWKVCPSCMQKQIEKLEADIDRLVARMELQRIALEGPLTGESG